MSGIADKISFWWGDVQYVLSHDAYDHGTGIIHLPDGTPLKFSGGWLESCPPKINKLETLDSTELQQLIDEGTVVFQAEVR